MTESFHTRIPTLTEGELREYLRNHLAYQRAAVEAALAELQRRGLVVPDEPRQQLLAALHHRDSAQLEGAWSHRLLGAAPEPRRTRVRLLTAAILLVGLGTAVVLHRTAQPKAPNPLGYEPEDTKKYLRELERVGGKANVVATQFMGWFDGLWQGQQLATTTAILTLSLAACFWFVASPPPTRRGP